MMFEHRMTLQAISLLACGLLASGSHAQQGVASGFPNKPVTLIVPFAPSSTPPAILPKITADIQDIMKQHDTIKAFNDQGASAAGSSSVQFKTLIDTDLKRYTKIIQEKILGLIEAVWMHQP